MGAGETALSSRQEAGVSSLLRSPLSAQIRPRFGIEFSLSMKICSSLAFGPGDFGPGGSAGLEALLYLTLHRFILSPPFYYSP